VDALPAQPSAVTVIERLLRSGAKLVTRPAATENDDRSRSKTDEKSDIALPRSGVADWSVPSPFPDPRGHGGRVARER